MTELPYTVQAIPALAPNGQVTDNIVVMDEHGRPVAFAIDTETADRIAFCLNVPALLLRRAANVKGNTLARAITEQIANDIKHGVL